MVHQQAQGMLGTTMTATATSVTWVEQANAYVDLAAGVIAVVAGLCTIAWYIVRFYNLRGVDNDTANTSKQTEAHNARRRDS